MPNTEETMEDNRKEARPDLFESHQGQKSAAKPCYVAMLEHTEQVGMEEWQTFKEAKILTGKETVDDLIAWGKTWEPSPQIVIVVAS